MELENDMPTLVEKTEAIARRRARFVQYVKDGLSCAEIADLEGIREDNASTERRKIAKEEGITLAAKTRSVSAPRAAGVMEVPSLFRNYLSMQLTRLIERHSPEDLAVLTGLNPAAQRQVVGNPYAYNWTLGQLSRTAKALGKTFDQLMREALDHKPLGEIK